MAATELVDNYKSSDDEDPDYQSSIDDQGECDASHTNYTTDLAYYLNQLRKEETLCDITIVVNHHRFPAHKTVLSAASNYFAAMFTGGFQESNQAEVMIEGSNEVFERLLDFAYTGVMRMNTELIADIISMASYMQFNKVVPLCSQFLKAAYEKKLVHLPDAFNIFILGMAHDFPSLQKHSHNYLAKHLVKFSETYCFLEDAAPEFVESMLYRKDLVLWAKEEQILKALVAWLKQDWEERKQYAVLFLRHIRLGLVPLVKLKQVIDTDIQAIPECKEMLEEVEKCLVMKETSKPPLSYQFPHLFASRGTVTAVIAIDDDIVKCHGRKKWQTLDRFPGHPVMIPDRLVLERMKDHQLLVVEENLYLAGGAYYESFQREPAVYFNNFFHYDKSYNRWLQLAPMLTKRSRFSMVHVNGFIYAIGGIGGDQNGVLQNVERFSLETLAWEEVSNLPVAIKHISSVVYYGVILVYGIHEENPTETTREGSLFAFDPARNMWISLASEILPINEELENNKKKPCLPPALVMEKGECFRVVYYGSRIPKVCHVTINLSEDNPSATFSEPHNPKDQELVEAHHYTNAGAFAINKRLFVNLNGYIHRLFVCLDEDEDDGFGRETDILQTGKDKGNEEGYDAESSRGKSSSDEEERKEPHTKEVPKVTSTAEEISPESLEEMKEKNTVENVGEEAEKCEQSATERNEDSNIETNDNYETGSYAESFYGMELFSWRIRAHVPAVKFTFDLYSVVDAKSQSSSNWFI